MADALTPARASTASDAFVARISDALVWAGRPADASRYAVIFALAFVPRLAYLLFARPRFQGLYWALASGLLKEHSLSLDGTATTAYEPLYPLFLAAARLLLREHVLAVQISQIVVASAGAVLLYHLTRLLTRTAAIAMISAVLYAVDPLLVRQAVEHSEAPLITTLLIAFTCAFVSMRATWGAVFSGVLLGLAVLTRSMVAPMIPLAALLVLASRQYRHASAVAVSALLVLMPMLARNYAVDGSWLPSRGGLNLFVGNNPYTSAVQPEYDVDLLQPYAYEIVKRAGLAVDDDHGADAVLTARALAYMAEDPLRTVGQKIRNVWYFFSPRLVPFETRGEDTRVVIAADGRVLVENSHARPRIEIVASLASYPIVLAASLAGVFLRRRQLRQDTILWCLVATFIVVAAVYFPATRYRGPMSFVLLFYASVAFERGARLLARRACG